MNEIEIKLGFPNSRTGEVLRELAILLKGKGNVRSLSNTYYDTPELSLRKYRWALRVRYLGEGRYEQTVKGMGKAQAGLHQRIEHNWPIGSESLDYELLKTVAAFPAENIGNLRSVFSTDFVRTAWKIERKSVQDEAIAGQEDLSSIIEVACDNGAIKVYERQDLAISEIELELLRGQIESLVSVGKKLVESIPCWLYTPSKAARGYGLLVGGYGFYSREIDSITTLGDWVDVMGRYVQQLVNGAPESVEVRDFSILVEMLVQKVSEAGFTGDPWDSLLAESKALKGINSLDKLSHEISRSTWLGRIGMEILDASLRNG